MKIGVFDIDSMVHALPEYSMVDSLMEIYESENSEEKYYQTIYNELEKTDEPFRYCKSAPYDKKFLDSINLLRQKLTVSLIYGQQILDQERKERKKILSKPLYQKVKAAFDKVIRENKYDLVLKPGSILFGNNVDNLFVVVAKELNLASLPVHLEKLGNVSNQVNTNY